MLEHLLFNYCRPPRRFLIFFPRFFLVQRKGSLQFEVVTKQILQLALLGPLMKLDLPTQFNADKVNVPNTTFGFLYLNIYQPDGSLKMWRVRVQNFTYSGTGGERNIYLNAHWAEFQRTTMMPYWNNYIQTYCIRAQTSDTQGTLMQKFNLLKRAKQLHLMRTQKIMPIFIRECLEGYITAGTHAAIHWASSQWGR